MGSALDNNGNTLTKVDSTGTTTYTWDFENRLTSVQLPGTGGTVTFAYDPFGRRIKKASSSATSIFAYDADNLIEETNATGAVVARYEQGLNIDEPLAMLRGTTTSYYNADGLGSVTSLSNSSGANVATYTFDSFGNLTASTGSLVNPFRYTGRELDPETSLYYYRTRYYDPSAGRFLVEDPITFTGGIDFYTYVENNPVELTDAFGLQARPKPFPTPTPIDPTPGRPVLVPDPVERPLPFCVRFPIICAIGLLLSNPMDLNPNEPDPAATPDPGPGRRIPPPKCPSRGCTCTCRADADDTMLGNIKPGLPLFAFGTATASSCAEAVKDAKRIATRSLGMKPKHIPCVCAQK